MARNSQRIKLLVLNLKGNMSFQTLHLYFRYKYTTIFALLCEIFCKITSRRGKCDQKLRSNYIVSLRYWQLLY